MIAVISSATSDWMLTPADSAQAVANVYTVSLLAIVPIIIAAIAAILLRRAPAGTRSLIWRSAVMALFVTYIVRMLPLEGMSWSIPSALAAPLVMLGRVQVTGASSAIVNAEHAAASPASIAGDAAPFVQALMFAYLLGVVAVLAPTLTALIAARRELSRADLVRDRRWLNQLTELRRVLGIRRSVTLRVSSDSLVPRTWGLLRPVIVLPAAALEWTAMQRRAVLLHELSHIRALDWPMGLVTRLVCALFWFHPGAWWIARGLKRESEYACDDNVLSAGVRPSDYAELLALAADALDQPSPAQRLSTAVALSRRDGLRERLGAVLNTTRDLRSPSMVRRLVAVALALVVSLPVGTVRLAPTREVLTELMQDSRWESRAYAVIGLAQRVDSIASARRAAAADPSPRVRAWAQYALARQNTPVAH